MALGSYSHELDFVLIGGLQVRTRCLGRTGDLTTSLVSPLTSSRPACTLSTMQLIALAYFLPFSPSNITPECLIIVTGWPRDSSMYSSTDRCDVNETSVCSSSGDAATLVSLSWVVHSRMAKERRITGFSPTWRMNSDGEMQCSRRPLSTLHIWCVIHVR